MISSILLSHCDNREKTAELYSAVRAFEELLLDGFPETDCRFITAIIAHQTLLRAAWTAHPMRDPPEVIAYYQDGDDFKLAAETENSEKVGLALQNTLFPFLETGIEERKEIKSRDLKTLRLIYPPFDSGIGGARGAAKAALEDWIQHEKQRRLLECRDSVQELGDSFTVDDVLKRALPKDEKLLKRFIIKEEIEAMLVTESESLGLIRTAREKIPKNMDLIKADHQLSVGCDYFLAAKGYIAKVVSLRRLSITFGQPRYKQYILNSLLQFILLLFALLKP